MKTLIKDIGKLGLNLVIDASISCGMFIATIVAAKAWITECSYLGDEITENVCDVGSDIKNVGRKLKNKFKKN